MFDGQILQTVLTAIAQLHLARSVRKVLLTLIDFLNARESLPTTKISEKDSYKDIRTPFAHKP